MATDGAGSRIVEVTLPNGAIALVRAVDLDGGATKTKFGDRFDFTDVGDPGRAERNNSGLADQGRAGHRDRGARPRDGGEGGKVTGLLVEGEGSGSLAVTLEWQRNGDSGGHGASDRP